MYRSLLFTLFGFALSLFSEAAGPSALILKNGDRLTGEIVREADGKMIVRTEAMGVIAVTKGAIEKVVAVSAVLGGSEVAKPAAQSQPVPAPAPKPPPPPAAAVAKAPVPPSAPAAAPQRKTWGQIWRATKGSMEASFNDQTGRHTSKNLTLRGDLDYVDGLNRYHIDGRYYYGKYDGYLHSDRRDTSFRWRRDLTKRYFFQSTTSHTLDNVKLIDFNLEQNLGLGWAAISDKRQDLNFVAGATGQSRKAFGQDTDTIALAELSQQYSLKLNDRLTFRHDASAQYSSVSRSPYVLINGQMIPSNTEAENYRLRLNVALQGKLTERISMTLRYEYEYDNVVQAANLKSDQRTSTSVGYHF